MIRAGSNPADPILPLEFPDEQTARAVIGMDPA